jgi:hypothetical protein
MVDDGRVFLFTYEGSKDPWFYCIENLGGPPILRWGEIRAWTSGETRKSEKKSPVKHSY